MRSFFLCILFRDILYIISYRYTRFVNSFVEEKERHHPYCAHAAEKKSSYPHYEIIYRVLYRVYNIIVV